MTKISELLKEWMKDLEIRKAYEETASESTALIIDEYRQQVSKLKSENNRLRHVIRFLAMEIIKVEGDDDDEIVGSDIPVIHITSVEYLYDWMLHLTFSNGEYGNIDLEKFVDFTGTLAPLSDKYFFSQVTIQNGSLSWSHQIDMDSTVLYHLTMGLPIDLAKGGKEVP